MKDQGEPSEKETRRKEKLNVEEAETAARDQERRKASLAREQAIEKASDSRHTQRAEKRAAEEAEQLAREQARKKAYDAREKDAAEAQQARKLRDKEQSPK